MTRYRPPLPARRFHIPRVQKSRRGIQDRSLSDESAFTHRDTRAVGTERALIDSCLVVAVAVTRDGEEAFWVEGGRVGEVLGIAVVEIVERVEIVARA